MKNKIQRIVGFIAMNAVGISSALACPVCKKNQPKLLQGITHGAGPDSNWDYLIVLLMIAVVVGTFILSARHLLKPGETNANHIKHSILNTDL
jgi:hypothetical protein